MCRGIKLCECENSCRWLLTKYGKFTVNSMYLALKMGEVKWPHRNVWLVRIPLKTKVFFVACF